MLSDKDRAESLFSALTQTNRTYLKSPVFNPAASHSSVTPARPPPTTQIILKLNA